jgi:hypothetical protein
MMEEINDVSRAGRARKISRWFSSTKGNAFQPAWMWESTWGIWPRK